MCISHRSPEFAVVFEESLAALRTALRVPLTHEIIFTHGGGHGQMAAVPLNLCPSGGRADYLVTGTWWVPSLQVLCWYYVAHDVGSSHSAGRRARWSGGGLRVRMLGRHRTWMDGRSTDQPTTNNPPTNPPSDRSRRAVEEASKYITVNEMCAHHQDSTCLPPREEWMLDSGASYR